MPLARIFRLGFLADFLSRTVLIGFLTGVGFQVGIVMLGVALSLLRHVRHSSRPHTALLAPDPEVRWFADPARVGAQSAPWLMVNRFEADLLYPNARRFAGEVRALVEQAPTPVRWFVADAGAMTDLDFSAAHDLHDLCDESKGRSVLLVFGRVGPDLRADMDRHGIQAGWV